MNWQGVALGMLAGAVLAAFAHAASAPRSIQVQGHRGARAVLPENSIPAFEHAIAAGADVLELDVVITKDDVPVVSHDPVLNRKICSGPGSGVVREMTLEQIRQWDCGAVVNPEFPAQKALPGTRMPTLDEVLALAPKGNFWFNIETKVAPVGGPAPETFARLVYEVIRKHDLEKRVIVQSFDFRTLHAMRAIAPSIRLAALWSGGPRDYLSIAKEAGAEIVSPHYLLVNKDEVQKAHQHGLTVIPWTVNTPEGWDRMIEAGVDGIITDDPAALIQHLKARGLR